MRDVFVYVFMFERYFVVLFGVMVVVVVFGVFMLFFGLVCVSGVYSGRVEKRVWTVHTLCCLYLCYLKLKILFLLARVELVLELALGGLKLRIGLVTEVVDDDLVGELVNIFILVILQILNLVNAATLLNLRRHRLEPVRLGHAQYILETVEHHLDDLFEII